MRCQVRLCVYRRGLAHLRAPVVGVFSSFFFSREGSTAAQKRREGGVEGKEGERETERASGMRRHGREIERRN